MRKTLLAISLMLLLAAVAPAQEKAFSGEVRQATVGTSGPLLAALEDAFEASGEQEAWVGYSVPARENLRDIHHSRGGNVSYGHGMTVVNGVVLSYPEKGILPAGSADKAILYLFESGTAGATLERLVVLDLNDRYRFTLPLLWIGEMDGARSLDALRTALAGEKMRAREDALTAVAVHRGDEPSRILEGIVRGGDPVDLREDALFWLGFTVGEDDFEMLVKLEDDLEHPDLREELTFVYYLQKHERAIDRLIAMARGDRNRDVREQAIFWMGQLATARMAEELQDIVSDDPDYEIKKQAVFAISQMDSPGSIDKLMLIAREHSDPAVRKQAIFWIGQSGDERAVDLLAELLKK